MNQLDVRSVNKHLVCRLGNSEEGNSEDVPEMAKSRLFPGISSNARVDL
jgi:hypothetical protein